MFYMVPPLASVVLFVTCWQAEYLSHPLLVGAWCVVGLALQWFGATYSAPWVVGLVWNAATAIALTIRLKVP